MVCPNSGGAMLLVPNRNARVSFSLDVVTIGSGICELKCRLLGAD